VEIFPNSGYEIALQPAPNAGQVNQICSLTKTLILTVKATYFAPDDRKFDTQPKQSSTTPAEDSC
jgi:hypothetical protein